MAMEWYTSPGTWSSTPICGSSYARKAVANKLQDGPLFCMVAMSVLWRSMDPRDLVLRLLLAMIFLPYHIPPISDIANIFWVFTHSVGHISCRINTKIYIHIIMLFRWTGDFLIPDKKLYRIPALIQVILSPLKKKSSK